MFQELCCLLGILVLLRGAIGVASFIQLYFIRTSKIEQYRDTDGSTYALVTGASDGIGLALSRALLEKDFDVVLHSRSKAKLQRIQEELQAAYPKRKIAYVAADAIEPSTAVVIISKTIQEIEQSGGRLRILVNNLGGQGLFGTRTFAAFKDIPEDKIDASISLNAVFPVLLTRAMISFLQRTSDHVLDRPHGLVLNVGSYAGSYPTPMGATYGLSKAALHHFSRCLALEANMERNPSLEAIGLLVGQVKTGGSGFTKTSFTVLAPEEAAEAILARVGCGESLVAAHWRHGLFADLMAWMPSSVRNAVIENVVKGLMQEEEAGLRRKKAQ